MRTAWSTLDRMHSEPARPDTVGSYLGALEAGRREEFRRLRAFVISVLPEAAETMGQRMPTFETRERICAIAAQKRHFALYVCVPGVLDRHRDAFAALDVGKGCIRFRRVDELPRGPARRLLREAAREVG